jgi:hypothetical protein
MTPRGTRVGVVATVVVTVASVFVVWRFSLGDDRSPVSSGVSTTTTRIPTTTQPTAPPRPDESAMWPAPGSGLRFTDPEAAARSFATAFLGFRAPIVDPFQEGDGRSGEVPIRPRANGPVTTVLLRQLGDDDAWSVLGSDVATIELASPSAGATITSPVRLRGEALAFEGHVDVEVREDGEVGAIGAGFVTGGGDVARPFDGAVSFETPGSPFGALVLLTRSAENGEVWEAEAMRVRFDSTDIDAASCNGATAPRPTPREGEMEVKVYFTCVGDTTPALRAVYRTAPSSPRVLETALRTLLAGPTEAERAASLRSWFSPATSDLLRSVVIVDGHAVVDFADLRGVLPNASASAGSELLLSQLDATVFQFRSVDSVEYRIDGDCETFNEWLQLGGCDPRTRPASED